MTMNKALQPKDDVDRLNVRKKGERQLASIVEYVDVTA